MMAQDIHEIHHFITEIENFIRSHNSPAALDKCTEAKAFIGLLKGGAVEA